jgi:hypothetical protein
MTDPTPGAYIPTGKAPPPRDAPTGPKAAALHAGRLALFALSVIGGLLGIWLLWMHLSSDPIADARAYYDAAHRLNVGQPLYPASADPNVAEFYRYPPLLAIILRPLALLPYSMFAILWEVVIVAVFVATIRHLGGGRRTWLAVGLLGIPIGWAIGVGQAQILTTYLLAVGQPWSIAVAGQLKLFPVLVAIWWLGRRDWQALGAFAGWTLILGLVQLFLEPEGTKAFLGLLAPDQIGEVRNFSPYVVSPVLWVVLATAGAVAAVLLAPTRWGWPAAIALATLSPPRLLTYMLTSLLAGIREPRQPGETPDGDAIPGDDAAAAYVASSR